MSETELHAEVTFYVPDDAEKINALHAKARELDEEEWTKPYTLQQALQLVWHMEPEWLTTNFLKGWTLDRAAIEGAPMRTIWETT